MPLDKRRKPRHYGMEVAPIVLVSRRLSWQRRLGLWLQALPARVNHRVRVILRCRWR
jgi:hypothetical protein